MAKKKAQETKRFPAGGVQGCFLKSAVGNNRLFFRIYSEDRKSFQDYDIGADDIFVTIDPDSPLDFIEYDDGRNWLDYNKEALGEK